nr:hypothetical protein [Armatimonas sp.]
MFVLKENASTSSHTWPGIVEGFEEGGFRFFGKVAHKGLEGGDSSGGILFCRRKSSLKRRKPLLTELPEALCREVPNRCFFVDIVDDGT